MKKIFAFILPMLLMATLSFGQAATAAKPQTAKPVTTTHVTKSGTPDKRFKENKAVAAPKTTAHLKKDGTPDKRFKENKTVSPK